MFRCSHVLFSLGEEVNVDEGAGEGKVKLKGFIDKVDKAKVEVGVLSIGEVLVEVPVPAVDTTSIVEGVG